MATKTKKRKWPKAPPRMADEDLRGFVEDWLAGRVVSSQGVPENLLKLVFMPLALGALAGAPKAYIDQIGLLYAVLGKDDSTGQAVNGFPIFFSLRTMHRGDLKIVADTIEVERERRKGLEIKR